MDFQVTCSLFVLVLRSHNCVTTHRTAKDTSDGNSSGDLMSPRMTADVVRSMYDAVEKRRLLKEKAGRALRLSSLHRSHADPGALTEREQEEQATARQTQRSYLRRLGEFDNIMGISPATTPRPLREWVQKNSKVLGLRVACPGSPFAQVLVSGGALDPE